MRIQLINADPCQVDSSRTGQEPLGLLYVAASLMKEGHEVRVLDYAIEPFTLQCMLEKVRVFDPAMIGFSARSASFLTASRMAEFLHRELHLPTLIGGQHASAAPEQVLRALPFAYVFRGEAEQSCSAFLRHWERSQASSSVRETPGLSYRVGNELIHNPDAPLQTELDSLPQPARHLLPYDRYAMAIDNQPAINLISSRGCPYRCYFCDKSISRSGCRFRGPESIADEIEYAIHQLGRRAVYFVDDLFLLNRRRIYALFNLLRRRRLEIIWRCLARVDSVDSQFLRDLRAFGCRKITFGVETGDAETLQRIGKRTTLEKAERALGMAQEIGIPAKANFVFGFPWETRESILQTITFACRLNVIDEYDFFLATPYPGTAFWNDCRRRGWIQDDVSLAEKMTQYHAVVPTEHLTRVELQELLLLAHTEIFRLKWRKHVPMDGCTFVARHTGAFLYPALNHLPFEVLSPYQKLFSMAYHAVPDSPPSPADVVLRALDGTLPAWLMARMNPAPEFVEPAEISSAS